MYGTFHLLTTAQAIELVLEAFLGPALFVALVLRFTRRHRSLPLKWYALAFLALLPPLALVVFTASVRGGNPPYDAIYVPPFTSGRAAQLSFASSVYMAIALIPSLVAPPPDLRRARFQLGIALALGFLCSLVLVPLRVPLTQPVSLLLRSFLSTGLSPA